MLYTFSDSTRRFGSQYLTELAVREGQLYKLEAGVYSDTGKESELEVIQFKYPKAVMTFESAYFYHDLTDMIPDHYSMATASNASAIKDARVKQYYVPAALLQIGISEVVYNGDKVRVYGLERLLVETARMKSKLPSDLYREVISSFRKRIPQMDLEAVADMIVRFPKREMIERIISEEVI